MRPAWRTSERHILGRNAELAAREAQPGVAQDVDRLVGARCRLHLRHQRRQLFRATTHLDFLHGVVAPLGEQRRHAVVEPIDVVAGRRGHGVDQAVLVGPCQHLPLGRFECLHDARIAVEALAARGLRSELLIDDFVEDEAPRLLRLPACSRASALLHVLPLRERDLGAVDRRRYTIVSRLRRLQDSDEFATLPEELRQRIRDIVADRER